MNWSNWRNMILKREKKGGKYCSKTKLIYFQIKLLLRFVSIFGDVGRNCSLNMSRGFLFQLEKLGKIETPVKNT